MPTPIEILLTPVSLIVLSLYAGLAVWEKLAPGRTLPEIRGWKRRGLVSFAVYFFLAAYLPLFWDEHLARYRLVDLTGFGVIGGALAGLLLYELVAYVWHRAMHDSKTLWRVFHQMHHSAERLDVYGAFYFSPLDMIAWTFVASFSLVLVVGVSPQSATLLLLTLNFLVMFQHANIRTPHWLGYFIQRPESHTVHHGRDIHYFNFADLPVFDMLFGSFYNPRGYEHHTGFYDGGSARVLDMLLFKDINKNPPERRAALTAG